MANSAEIDRYADDPSLLVELCREVIDHLDSGSVNEESPAMEAQLREIAKAIEKLEKMGVPVPDPLRAEKTRLAAALSTTTEASRTLRHLHDEFEELVKDLKSRIVRDSGETTGTRRPRAPGSKAPKTDSQTFRRLIIESLRKFGGRAKVSEVLDEVEKQLKGKFLPGDLEVRQDGKTLAWRNNAQWERLRMVHDGTLRSDSSNGIWELSR